MFLQGIYLSSKSEHKSLIIDSFEQWYEQNLSDKIVVIMGDFNIDLLSVSTYSRQFNDFCDNNGLSSLINTVTRKTKSTLKKRIG